jgi:Ca2+-transporting ATPase
VLYWPPLNALFHTVPIAPVDLLPIVALASVVLWAEELRKLVVRRWGRSGLRPS